MEDAQGKQLAKVIANRKSGLLKKYEIVTCVACVRDVYLETPENTQIMDAKRSGLSQIDEAVGPVDGVQYAPWY